jgi:hypothetical protein
MGAGRPVGTAERPVEEPVNQAVFPKVRHFSGHRTRKLKKDTIFAEEIPVPWRCPPGKSYRKREIRMGLTKIHLILLLAASAVLLLFCIALPGMPAHADGPVKPTGGSNLKFLGNRALPPMNSL